MVSIHSGVSHAFAINVAGAVWAWGLNNYGQTVISSGAGNNDPIIRIPQRVRSLPPMKAIAGGAHHSVGLAQDGKCFVWGRIDGFQTGLPLVELANRPDSEVIFDRWKKPRILLKPLPLPIPKCTCVAVGTDHSIATTETGEAYSWGLNTSAQYGQGTEDDVEEVKLMEAKTIRDKNIKFAIAGAQFSMIGIPATLGTDANTAYS